MRSAVVVVVDPWDSDANHVVEVHESVLPNAFALEGLVIGFDHSVLLGGMRMDELLAQTIRCEETSIQP